MQDAELVHSALLQAGQVAMSFFRKNPRTWHKPDGSVLTEADLAVNAALHGLLTTARPGYGWLSEEGPEDPSRSQKRRSWILDPIDGTRPFSLGRSEWCIGLCLVEDGEPVISGVLHPATQQLAFAQKGRGTHFNGAAQRITDGPLAGARIAGRSTAFANVAATGAVQIDVSHTPQLARLVLLASGQADAVLSFGPKHDWDIAPGALLVSEAGGAITTQQGAAMRFNQPEARQHGLVAASPARHAAIMKLVESPQ